MNEYIVGIDIGGTFTDAFVTTTDGRSWTGKSRTTHGNLAEGLIGALTVAAEGAEISLHELLSKTVKFAHGTTVVTNAIAEMKGAKVGLITTRGCKDLLTIARSPREYEFDFLKHQPIPNLVDRRCIVEVAERVDSTGTVLAPLQEDGIEAEISRLVEKEKVEAIAICFLWSFLRPEHEQRVREIVRQRYPNLYVSISSDIHPAMREYERLTTTLLNSFAGNVFVKYSQNVETVLEAHGLSRRLLMMSSAGGALSAQEAVHRPVALAYSGPAGGVLGATTIARKLNIPKLLTTDMGGTSYDVSIVVDGKPLTRNKAKIGPFWTGLSTLDIEAIGAGGGSLAWIDARGMVQVGPRSAGSIPGPACYGQGGLKPTVTDAAVMLGILDPDYFLGGKVKLHPRLAEEALQREVGNHIGQSARDTAAGIFQVVTANMANAARYATIGRGLDPRDFAMLSYGGCGPMFAVPIARELGIKTVIVPEVSAVFSAYGAARTDIRRERYRTLRQPVPVSTNAVNEVFASLAEQVRADLIRDGVAEGDMSLLFEADFQYAGQVSPFNVAMPTPPLSDAEAEGLRSRFETEYERLLGQGTAVSSSPVELINCRVVGIGKTIQPETVQDDAASSTSAIDAIFGERKIYLPYEKKEVTLTVFHVAKMRGGMGVQGPAIIERNDTTIYLQHNATARMDEDRNVIITLA